MFVFFEQIRAGHLSGDCHFKRELLRGFIKLRGHEQVSDYKKKKLLVESCMVVVDINLILCVLKRNV